MQVTVELANAIIEFVRTEPIVTALATLLLFVIVHQMLFVRRLSRFMKGADGKSLEGTLRKISEQVGKLESHAKETSLILKEADERLSRSVQAITVKRYDPFGGSGGQQSFVTVFANEHGDGVAISGIHARDGVRVYAKEVTAFASERELSEEEKSAIDEAKKLIG